jgi:hypothetical protein
MKTNVLKQSQRIAWDVYFRRFSMLMISMLFLGSNLSAQLLVGWDVNGLTGYGPSPYAASQVQSGVSATGLTRGSGVSISGTAAGNALGGSGWNGPTSAATAASTNHFVTFTITPNAGSVVNFSQIASYGVRRSGTGPNAWQWQYQINSNGWNNIGSTVSQSGSSSSGYTKPAISLSSYSDLQGVTPSETVTFRLLLWGASSSGGTFYIYNRLTNDLQIDGTISTLNVPSVNTNPISAVTAISANGGGNVTSDGGAAVFSRGVVWSTSSNPTMPSANSTSNGTGTGTYASSIAGLTANTFYNVRAYAINSVGTSYGTNVTFTTNPNAPNATAATAIATTSFNANWTAPSHGSATFTYDIEVATDNAFSSIVGGATGLSSASTSFAVTGLNPATDYYYHVRATNANGSSAYSTTVGPVTTLTPAGPIAITTAAFAITNTGATLAGTIDANGTTANAFFDYGINASVGSPAVATPSSVTGTGATSIEYNLTGLSANTSYYYRARANAGILGVVNSFVTLANVPGVIAYGAPTSTSITIASINTNGNPVSTEFAIVSSSFSNQYLQFNGTFGPIPYFQTASNWVNFVVGNLNASTPYHFAAIAQNSDGIPTSSGAATFSTTSGCAAPIVSLTGISNSNVTINLSNSTGSFEYNVNTSAASPASGTATSGSSVAEGGLVATTAYYTHVRNVCGSIFSPWTNTPFTTSSSPAGIVAYDFDGCSLCPNWTADIEDANVTSTSFSRGSGISTNAGANYFNNAGFNTSSPSFASAAAQNEYVEFSVSANAGYEVTYTSLDFTHRRSGTGPGNTRIAYSTNGGSAWTYNTTDPLILSGTSDVDVTWTLPTPLTTSGNVIFRVWAWGATGAAGTYRVDNVTLSGIVTPLCVAPSLQAQNVVVNNIANSSADISWTNNGVADARYVFITSSGSASPALTNGNDYAPSTAFGSGGSAGLWYCIYAGTGTSVSVSNLSPGLNYKVFVANANCAGSNVKFNASVDVSNPVSFLTTNVPVAQLSSGPLAGFGSTCVNTEIEQSVSITGVNLDGSAVSITAPAGFALSFTSGESYNTSLSLPYTGSNLNSTVYVQFNPATATAFSGSIQVIGGSASLLNIPVSGTAINTVPTVSSGLASFISTTGATIAGSLTLGCAPVFSEYGVEYSVSPSFTPGNGAIVQSAFTGNSFNVALSNLAVNTIYYYRAYGINQSVTYYGSVGSFSTLSGALETIYNYGDDVTGVPFYVHPTLSGSNLTKSSTGWTPTTPCGSGFSGFGLSAANTSYSATGNPYVQVDITPNVIGNQVQVERISVQLRSTPTAVNSVMMAYSIDGGLNWSDRGVPELPNIGGSCGSVSSNSWLLPSPVVVGSPLAANNLKIRLYYYHSGGSTGGNNQILNLVVLGRILTAPDTYYSVSSGNVTDPIWSASSTGTVGQAVIFTPEINMVVQGSHSVILNQTETLVKNLTVNGGGNLQAASTDFSTMRNISVYANATIFGSIGNGSSSDAIGMNVEGSTTTLSGNGIINLGRIRKQSSFNNATLLNIQAQNVNLRYPGAALYNNASDTYLNVVVSSATTLNVIGSSGTPGNVSIDGPSDADAGQKAGSITVNGFMNVSGSISIASSNNTNPYLSSLVIGASGTVNATDVNIKNNAVNSTTINAGGKLNVSGILRVRQGTLNSSNGITLSTGAILLHGAGTPGLSPDPGGIVNGNVKVKANGTTTVGAYNYWSSPISNSTLQPIMQNGASTGSLQNTYMYDATLATDASIEGLRAGWISQVQSNSMAAGKGYITTTAGAVTFTGLVNEGAVNLPAIQGAFTNFNLVGNPYPGPLDASAFLTANQTSNIIPAIYFWDDDASVGADYNVTDYIVSNAVGTVGTGGNGDAANFTGRIATGQGFMVEARTGASSIVFNNSMRTTGSATLFEAAPEFSKLWLRISGEQSLNNETLIAFGNVATDAYDDLFDAKKISGNENISLSSRIDTIDYAIQALSSLSSDKVIPLSVSTHVGGAYTFQIAQFENFDSSVIVYLEDVENATYTALNLNSYTVTLADGFSSSTRFRLHLSSPVAIEATDAGCDGNDGSISIEGSTSGWNYQVIGVQSGLMLEGSLSSTIEFNELPADVYNVTMTHISGVAFETVEVITAASQVTVDIILSAATVEAGESVSFEVNASSNVSTSWSISNGDVLTGNSIDNYSFELPGVYTIEALVSNGVCSTTITREIIVTNIVTSIESNLENNLELLPNPADKFFKVNAGNSTIKSITVTDLSGKVLVNRNIDNTSVVINTDEFSNGVYFIQMNIQDALITKKVVVAH